MKSWKIWSEIRSVSCKALRVIAAGERVLHENAIVHALRHYDDKIDRNAVTQFFIDTCKACEKVGLVPSFVKSSFFTL